MSSICFYFQVHQPYRLKEFTCFDNDSHFDYFSEKNETILKKVAEKCYIPTNKLLLELINKFKGKFRVSFSISGVALEQFKDYAPEVLESFQDLVKTGCVEILGETYYHSLSAVYNEDEFKLQVKRHTDLVRVLFNLTPQVFRNTELIYNNRIGNVVSELGFKGIIAEGCDDVLDWRSPNYLYQVKDNSMALLLKNYKLSDDIAFRFSNQGWAEFPLMSEKFASWVHQISGAGDICNLFMDYETFGEHQWSSTGIFEFLRHLPDAILAHPDWDFKTPSEVVESYPKRAEIDFFRLTSWADTERDLTAWRGNDLQLKSLNQIYALAEKIRKIDNFKVTDTWRRLQTSDLFYYMCTKWFADGDVHAYFSPYTSPYLAFVNYQNVLDDFISRIDQY